MKKTVKRGLPTFNLAKRLAPLIADMRVYALHIETEMPWIKTHPQVIRVWADELENIGKNFRTKRCNQAFCINTVLVKKSS
jgi:hypothetical protein